jgi:starch phosphorylase
MWRPSTGAFSLGDPASLSDVVNAVWQHNHFLVAVSFAGYYAAQRTVDDRWLDRKASWRLAVISYANVGLFSFAWVISEYKSDIWGVLVRPAG